MLCVLCGCNCNDFHLMRLQKLHSLHILLSFYAWIKASVTEMLPDTQVSFIAGSFVTSKHSSTRKGRLSVICHSKM